MIIPSIDLMGGITVQLRGGKTLVLEAGDPRPFAQRFGLVGEVAVVDLDAALGQGSNADLMRELLPLARCRVGGGIRDVKTALDWLDGGASKVVLGTAAVPEVLRELPSERVIAALDAKDGQVVVEGWRKKTGRGIVERMQELNGLVGGYLVTFVEREGSLSGIDMERVKEVVAAAGDARVTVAGGVATAEEVAEIDRLGADAQVGMALYSGRLDEADCIAAILHNKISEGLWPTVVADELGISLGLVWSDLESLRMAVRTRRGVYHSRARGLWIKGATSGDTQELLGVDLDCDRDVLRFTVRQHGRGFCHLHTRTCWGDDHGLTALFRRLQSRLEQAPAGSYTRRLLTDDALLKAKLVEEAGELGEATDQQSATWEAADLIYFTVVRMLSRGVSLEDVQTELDRRSMQLKRRGGDAKT